MKKYRKYILMPVVAISVACFGLSCSESNDDKK